MTDKNLTVQNEKSLATGDNLRERYVAPAVDIFETDEGLTFMADVPGMSKDDLRVDINNGILTIEGRAGSETPGKRIYSEFAPAGYYRQFHLPELLDGDKAQAELHAGVLTLHLPKVEAARPKRIEIKTIH
ncbi:Hsp20/alpha crystallin family protein [Geothermobacter hydrogeniphilus]|uniref:SHSP domain-containing protein n=1 Tax=Geothermobacter hydrogeniphilus TaxID=1969733 RepID=A0A1X0XQ28_9BACT|nr:Hsp20/alpha crystallin family protein [Geothermobacter hydrogeniphilus]ORJ54983.1 hypothetical protein B5V00_15485 [Geothermobacter hydrogeniphilus]